MPRTKKSLLSRNLASYDVFIEDNTLFSDYFNVMNLPSVFSGGRNSFLIGGSSLLADRSDVLVEILDVLGKPIYQSPVRGYSESSGKLITMEIYDTTPLGFATVIIMGRATRTATGEPIPDEWQNKYNVRWSRRVITDPNIQNVAPIRFINTPAAFVEENLFKTISTPSYVTQDIDFTASLSPILFSSIHTGYSIAAVAPTTFSADLYGGSLTGSIRVAQTDSIISLPITNILNSSTMYSNGYLIENATSQVRSVELRSGSYVTQVNNVSQTVTSSVKIRYSVLNEPLLNINASYAKLRVVNLATVSGELYKLRVYAKPKTRRAEYKLVSDATIAPSELLVTESVRGNLPIGNFITTPDAQNNWYADALVPNTSTLSILYPISGSLSYYTPASADGTPTVQVTDDVLLRSIRAEVPLDGTLFSEVSESGFFIGTKDTVRLFPTTEYTLTLDAYYKNRSGSVILTGNAPKVDIYLVGNVIDENPLGQRIGTLDVSADTRWFQTKQFNFTPKISNDALLGIRFVITNGFWYFSNISLQPATERMFSPDEVQLIIPNTDYNNEVLEYKVEFFDINSNSANISAVAEPTFFTGSAIDLGTLP